jgi:hypothetical protein
MASTDQSKDEQPLFEVVLDATDEPNELLGTRALIGWGDRCLHQQFVCVLPGAHQRSCVDVGVSGEILEVADAASADEVDEVDDKRLSGEYTVRGAPCLSFTFEYHLSTQRQKGCIHR